MHCTGQNWEILLVANSQNIIKIVYFKFCFKELSRKCSHNKAQNANKVFFFFFFAGGGGAIWKSITKSDFICLKTEKRGVLCNDAIYWTLSKMLKSFNWPEQ